VPLPAPVHYHTFAGIYADEEKDPLRNRYEAVLQRFDAGAPQAQIGADLLQSIIENTTIPNAFLCCATLHEGAPARVYVVHALSRYPQAPDGTPSHWDNRIFGYLGEILQETPTVVSIPNTAFNAVNNVGVRVYTKDNLAIQLAQLDVSSLFPWLNANAANGEFVFTRYVMRLPLKYAPLLLSPKGYSPKEAYA
jgi:hypothetical protein